MCEVELDDLGRQDRLGSAPEDEEVEREVVRPVRQDSAPDGEVVREVGSGSAPVREVSTPEVRAVRGGRGPNRGRRVSP